MATLVGLAGCQGFGDQLACDDQVADLKARATVYETDCYFSRYVSHCRTVPRVELRHTSQSRAAQAACVDQRRFERRVAEAEAEIRKTGRIGGVPAATFRDMAPGPPPSPDNNVGWHAFGETDVRERPDATARSVETLEFGQAVRPMAEPRDGWLLVHLPRSGRAGFIPADRIFQRR